MPWPAALPSLLSGLRLVLMPVLWWAAFAGLERLVGAGLVLAGATDYLDGLLARRLGVASPAGDRLDAAAVAALLLSAALCLVHLHPDIATGNAGLLTATVFIYGVSLVIGIARSGRIRHAACARPRWQAPASALLPCSPCSAATTCRSCWSSPPVR